MHRLAAEKCRARGSGRPTNEAESGRRHGRKAAEPRGATRALGRALRLSRLGYLARMSGPGERGFLILHGLSNRRPPEHWEHWLTDQLRDRGELVRYPQLPDPDEPDREAWEQVLVDELERIGERERIVVAHSLGATTWLGLGSRVPANRRAARSLLVAPPAPSELTAIAPGFAELPPRREALRGLGVTTIVASDTDPYDPDGARASFGWLELPIQVIAGAGHFRPDDGYGPWPAALEWCLGG